MVTKSQQQAEEGGGVVVVRPRPPRRGRGLSGALTLRLCVGSELRGPDHRPVGAGGRPAAGRRLLLLLLLLWEAAEPAAGQERGEGRSGARGAPGPPGGAVRPRDRGRLLGPSFLHVEKSGPCRASEGASRWWRGGWEAAWQGPGRWPPARGSGPIRF